MDIYDGGRCLVELPTGQKQVVSLNKYSWLVIACFFNPSDDAFVCSREH